MAEPKDRRVSSLWVSNNQPLIGVTTEEQGQERVCYFAEEEAAGMATSQRSVQAALHLAGAWSDLNWQELEPALDRIRHQTPPSPSLEL